MQSPSTETYDIFNILLAQNYVNVSQRPPKNIRAIYWSGVRHTRCIGTVTRLGAEIFYSQYKL